MVNKKKRNLCSGCTACAETCPRKAITMIADSLGFLYPHVDASLCTNCGICEKICQFNDKYNRYSNFYPPLVYSGRLKDELELKNSQSGGAFYAIASFVIEGGGVVYGAAFEETFKVSHLRVRDKENLEKLRLSKYVQSDIRGVYARIKEDLQNDLTVLFSGTSCQVAGLKATLPRKLHNKLLCVDIVCHGVPSPAIWKDNLEYIEKKYRSSIIAPCFRNKKFGWHGAVETYVLNNGKEVRSSTSNYLYFQGLSLRESCANCKYTNLYRVGDISLGDFWGLPNDSPYELDQKGVSLILCNSQKGKVYLEYISERLHLFENTLTECLQPQLKEPSKLSPLRKSFVADYEVYGYKYVAKKYGNLGWHYKKEVAINFLRKVKYSIIKLIGLKK